MVGLFGMAPYLALEITKTGKTHKISVCKIFWDNILNCLMITFMYLSERLPDSSKKGSSLWIRDNFISTFPSTVVPFIRSVVLVSVALVSVGPASTSAA